MKKLILVISLLFSVCAFAQIEKVVPNRPNPPRLVNDIAHKLTDDQVYALERKLDSYDDSTSNQIAVVVLSTITDPGGTEYPIEEVGLKILRDWGVGTAKNNNGVVIVIALAERKIRIETGYGLEGAIPDVTARSIIDNDLSPNFRQDNYYRGIDEATNSIIKAAAGEYQAPEGYRQGKGNAGKSIGKIIVGIIILFVILGMFGGGNKGGGYTSRRGSSWLGPLILGSMLGNAGRGGGWSGGGGGWSGGGGGFGGFGGGGGGGGGASGGW